MAIYYEEEGALRTGAFLGGGGTGPRLSPGERARKRAKLDCFVSPRAVLARFSDEVEWLRPAPAYDFALPPHPPPLHYDRHGWPLDSARFRALATAALGALRLTRAGAGDARRSG